MKKTLPFLLVFVCSVLQAQDIHFSMQGFALMQRNPALTGSFDGKHRLAVDFRTQWNAVPVSYNTGTAAYDSGIGLSGGKLGVGVQLFNDQAGDSRLSNTMVNVGVAWHQKISKKGTLSGGFSGGLGQKRFRSNKLTFDSQWTGDSFNPNEPTQENFPKKSFLYADINAGINTAWQLKENIRMEIGGSGAHFNTPKMTFRTDDKSFLPVKWTVHTDFTFGMKKIDICPSLIWQKQGTYNLLLTSFLTRYRLDTRLGREFSLLFGAAYRLRDATVFQTGFEYQNSWRLGISYDVNTSGFHTATNYRGAFEVGLMYIIRNVEQRKMPYLCPVF